MSSLAKQNSAVEQVLAAADALPANGKELVIRELLASLGPSDLKKLSAELRAALRVAVRVAVSENCEPVPLVAATERVLFRGSNAVQVNVSAPGQDPIRAILSEKLFGLLYQQQTDIAAAEGARLPTRKENEAVAKALLERERVGTTNEDEILLLERYRKGYLRDSEGGIFVNGTKVYTINSADSLTLPSYGALVILPLPSAP